MRTRCRPGATVVSVLAACVALVAVACGSSGDATRVGQRGQPDGVRQRCRRHESERHPGRRRPSDVAAQQGHDAGHQHYKKFAVLTDGVPAQTENVDEMLSVDPDAIKQAMEGIHNQSFLAPHMCSMAPLIDKPYNIPTIASS